MSRGRIVHSSSTEAPTLPDPLSYLEPSVDNCLEVAEKPTVPPPPTPPPPPSSTPAPPPPLLPVDDDEGEVAPTPPEEGGEEGESSSFVRTSVREPPIINPPLVPTEGEEGESSSFVRTSVREPPIVDPPLVEEVPAEPEMIGPVMIQPLSEMVDPIFTGDRAERVRRKRFLWVFFAVLVEDMLFWQFSCTFFGSLNALVMCVYVFLSPPLSLWIELHICIVCVCVYLPLSLSV